MAELLKLDPMTPPYQTNDRSSFAYISARDRWPVILHQGIDDIFRTTRESNDPGVVAEGKKLVEHMAKLKYELQHDRPITALRDDGGDDIKDYNAELEALGYPKWFQAPWLYTECYMYRRIRTFFEETKHWGQYDIFKRSKENTFKSSLPAVIELAIRYQNLFTNPESSLQNDKLSAEEKEEAEKILFLEFFEICLWGNATDLSLLTTLSYADIQKLQGSEARKKSEKNILVNDLGKVYDLLKKLEKEDPQKERRIDIVLDNAGFELFVDLILAGYLLETGLATTVVLHPKDIPWFVSDVLIQDFGSLLTALANPEGFFNTPEAETEEAKKENKFVALSEAEITTLKSLFENWAGHHGEGKIVIRPNAFWTKADSYWRLPHVAKDLVEDLKESECVIFKGDLNYRKLTADVMWPATTPFNEAIGPLGAANSGIRVLALRTCKADVVVGLPEGLDEKLKAEEGGSGEAGERKWGWSGKYAVVQFWDGKQTAWRR